ncbi:helix-turn-helix domain-containing protein [Longirhabdus pacifica]|uniref:helix-turn-helix domain-containing protein n=1 Tax=Longirhabdus pacifica TaxID=2305227 RepID=UPI0010088ED8|nr:helix-turn-helix transcriptional regulator [Longirhabdus pacifica]
MIETIHTLGELIKKHREQQEITMGQLQEELGINKGVISKIEKGDTKRPEFRTIFRIADALSIPHESIINKYVEVEDRPDVLHELLVKTTEITDDARLIKKIALLYLESDKHETEDALAALYSYAKKLENKEISLIIYIVIAEYARLRGVPPYIAKGLLQAYFIKRLDIQKDKQTYAEGKEIIHYMNFLTKEEQREYYFNMSIQAYVIKEYEESIELAKCGLNIFEKPTEMEARAYAAMINSYFNLEKYDKVEKHLHILKEYKYDFVKEFVNIVFACIKTKQKEYDVAVPMLKKCLEECPQRQKMYIMNELLDIYAALDETNEIHKIYANEEQFIFTEPRIPEEYHALGLYYTYKGDWQLHQDYHEKAMHSYSKSLKAYAYIQAYEELATTYRHIISSSIEKELDINQFKIIKDAAQISKEK